MLFTGVSGVDGADGLMLGLPGDRAGGLAGGLRMPLFMIQLGVTTTGVAAPEMGLLCVGVLSEESELSDIVGVSE